MPVASQRGDHFASRGGRSGRGCTSYRSQRFHRRAPRASAAGGRAPRHRRRAWRSRRARRGRGRLHARFRSLGVEAATGRCRCGDQRRRHTARARRGDVRRAARADTACAVRGGRRSRRAPRRAVFRTRRRRRGESLYHSSKRRADDFLSSLPLSSVVVQPSLVYGAGGTSAALFDTLASLPLIPLPAGGLQRVQPVHVEDVVAAVVALLGIDSWRVGRIAFVGPAPMTLREYLATLRQAWDCLLHASSVSGRGSSTRQRASVIASRLWHSIVRRSACSAGQHRQCRRNAGHARARAARAVALCPQSRTPRGGGARATELAAAAAVARHRDDVDRHRHRLAWPPIQSATASRCSAVSAFRRPSPRAGARRGARALNRCSAS